MICVKANLNETNIIWSLFIRPMRGSGGKISVNSKYNIRSHCEPNIVGLLTDPLKAVHTNSTFIGAEQAPG